MIRSQLALTLLFVSILVSIRGYASEEVFPVEVAPIDIAEFETKIEAYAEFAQKRQLLYFETSGFIEELLVLAGEPVEIGQPLARLDSVDLNHAVDIAQTAADHALLKLQQAKKLRGSEALPQEMLDDREFNFNTRSIELARLLEQRKRQTLKAPSNGIIEGRLMEYSAAVNPQTAVFSFVDARRPWRITAQLSQREVMRVSKGNRASIYIPDSSLPRLDGMVSAIQPAAADGTFPVEIDLLPDQDFSLIRSGLIAKVRIQTGNRKTGVPVPLSALVAVESGQATVFVVDDGHARALKVELGEITGQHVLVPAGLSDFSYLVVRGQHYLSDGVAVAIQNLP